MNKDLQDILYFCMDQLAEISYSDGEEFQIGFHKKDPNLIFYGRIIISKIDVSKPNSKRKSYKTEIEVKKGFLILREENTYVYSEYDSEEKKEYPIEDFKF